MIKRSDPVKHYDPGEMDWEKSFDEPVSEELGHRIAVARIQALSWVIDKSETIFDKEDEWDICCVLDACRFDTFKEVNRLPGDLSVLISPGFNTHVWVEKTFTVPHKDLVLVSCNAWTTKTLGSEYMEEQLHHYEPLWRTHWDKLRTVLPDIATEVAIRLHREHPTKKLVIHYMQPHDPFIANPDLSIKSERIWWQNDFNDTGRFTYAEIYELYKDNLRLVLKSIAGLIAETTGRVVITSDHGEGFGEFGIAWSHKGGYMPWLVRVPWFKAARKKS